MRSIEKCIEKRKIRISLAGKSISERHAGYGDSSEYVRMRCQWWTGGGRIRVIFHAAGGVAALDGCCYTAVVAKARTAISGSGFYQDSYFSE